MMAVTKQHLLGLWTRKSRVRGNAARRAANNPTSPALSHRLTANKAIGGRKNGFFVREFAATS
jgi:hypothetical protein